MRAWLAIAVMLVGCEKKPKSAPAQGSGSAGVAAAPADATRTPAADVVVDAALAADAGPLPLDPERLLDFETIGPLKLGLDDKSVVKLLGKPTTKRVPKEEGATGLFVSSWEWPDGVTLEMAGDKRSGPFMLRAITIAAPCPFKTSRGIGIGSTLAELSAHYPRNTEEGGEDPDEYLVGSIYGGELFTLKEGKVAVIFLGAMAF